MAAMPLVPIALGEVLVAALGGQPLITLRIQCLYRCPFDDAADARPVNAGKFKRLHDLIAQAWRCGEAQLVVVSADGLPAPACCRIARGHCSAGR